MQNPYIKNIIIHLKTFIYVSENGMNMFNFQQFLKKWTNKNWVIYYVFVVCPVTKILTLISVQAIQINDIHVWALWISKQPVRLNHCGHTAVILNNVYDLRTVKGTLQST